MSTNGEKEVEEVSKTLNITLPFGSMPLPMKIIAFLTTVGGLSIVASLLADVVGSADISFLRYLLRVIIGFLMLLIGYGIIKKKIWALWLYGSISVVGLFINFTENFMLALIPIAITGYLYYERDYFEKQTLEEVLKSLIKKLGLN